MALRNDTIAVYRNRANTHLESDRNGSSDLNDTEQRRNPTPISSQVNDMPPPSQDTSRVLRNSRLTETGRRNTTRQATITEYQNQPSDDAQNNDAHNDQSSPLRNTDDNSLSAPTQWPSHARRCRNLPENDANGRKKYGRGVLKGIKVAKKHFKNGSEKLPIEFSSRLGGTVGTNYRSFVDDVVVFMKNYAPLINARKWSDIHRDARRSIVKDMIERWNLEDTLATEKKILDIARERYRGWRSTLHSTYKAYNTDEERRRNRPEDVDADEWEYLIEYFGTDQKFQELSQKNSENLKKQKTKHLIGSKSYSQISYEKRNVETGEEPDDIQLWELTHVKNGQWSTNESQVVFNNAREKVSEKEKEGDPISKEERNTIFQASYKTSVGCKSSRFMHGRGYMAKPPSTAEILAELNEQARETSEAKRKNEELNQHVQDLENKNEELNLTIQDLENKLAAKCKERERAQEADHIEREKQLEARKRSMREEMLNMIGAQPTATQKDTLPRTTPGNVNTNNVARSLFKNPSSSFASGQGQRTISSQQLVQSALNRRPRVAKDGYI